MTDENIQSKTELNNNSYSKKVVTNFLKSDALILAVGTGLGYMFGFINNLGIFNYYGLPVSFMVINATDFLGISITIIFCIALIGPMIVSYVEQYRTRLVEEQVNLGCATAMVILFLLILFIITSYQYLDNVPNYVFITFVFMNLIFILSFILGGYNLKLFWKLITGQKKNSSFWMSSVTYSYIAIGLFLMVYILANHSVSIQEKYPIVNTNPECVILYFRGDSVVCSPFDRNTKEIEQIYKLVNLQDNSNLEIRYENIGPLSLKQLPTPISTNTPVPTNIPVPTIPSTANP